MGGLTQNQDWDTGDKGVLLIGTGTDNLGVKLGVGANGSILTADSTATYGVAWKSPAIQTPSVPSGSVMLFYQSSAPTGWTKVTDHDNKALRVVSGTGGGSGGSSLFTSVFTSRTPQGSVSGGSVSGNVSGGSVSVSVSGDTGNRTLSEGQMPSHYHAYRFRGEGQGGGDAGQQYGLTAAIDDFGYLTDYRDTDRRGSGQGHNHSFSGSGSGNLSGATFSGNVSGASFNGDSMNFAVQYIDVIICSKN